ncbi:hypothetical protein RND81_01G117800 [Saponaria officinalis]|uniref:ATPase family AAA domain-containing protein n=1 Tax=Saponaria officinalis TaxID=3572 RepID=A0AAW1NDX8_SAPOF
MSLHRHEHPFHASTLFHYRHHHDTTNTYTMPSPTPHKPVASPYSTTSLTSPSGSTPPATTPSTEHLSTTNVPSPRRLGLTEVEVDKIKMSLHHLQSDMERQRAMAEEQRQLYQQQAQIKAQVMRQEDEMARKRMQVLHASEPPSVDKTQESSPSIRKSHPPPAFGSSPNLEALALDGDTPHDDEENNDANASSRLLR